MFPISTVVFPVGLNRARQSFPDRNRIIRLPDIQYHFMPRYPEEIGLTGTEQSNYRISGPTLNPACIWYSRRCIFKIFSLRNLLKLKTEFQLEHVVLMSG